MSEVLQDDLTGLGRRAAADNRDLAYRLLAAPPKRGVRRKTHYIRGVLDQGGTSQCVAYSTSQYLKAHPVKNHLPMSEAAFYKECQRVDEWPGEDYDGTSVRASFKVLKRLGYVSEYRWTWDVDTVANHLLSTGPMVVGTSFFEGMAASDRFDFLRPEGEDYGGHAYLLVGCDLDRKCYDGAKGAFTMLNSWGPKWSNNGRALISFKDMQKLLDLQGEACVATEIPHAD